MLGKNYTGPVTGISPLIYIQKCIWAKFYQIILGNCQLTLIDFPINSLRYIPFNKNSEHTFVSIRCIFLLMLNVLVMQIFCYVNICL